MPLMDRPPSQSGVKESALGILLRKRAQNRWPKTRAVAVPAPTSNLAWVELQLVSLQKRKRGDYAHAEKYSLALQLGQLGRCSMVYFKRWEEYTEACHLLAEASPTLTRYCIRWRHASGLLVLKVTDNHKCLKFKTRSSAFLNRFELLNRSLLASFQQRRKAVLQEPSRGDGEEVGVEGESAVAAGGAGTGLARVDVVGQDEAKGKKKKGKKKK